MCSTWPITNRMSRRHFRGDNFGRIIFGGTVHTFFSQFFYIRCQRIWTGFCQLDSNRIGTVSIVRHLRRLIGCSTQGNFSLFSSLQQLVAVYVKQHQLQVIVLPCNKRRRNSIFRNEL
eukprot:Lithocolla_globosa_v1_NODE_427_length_4089_cov_17.325235.p3 type:complete len:118 gc:universal NODE_427_length_4089_cov_17.325235:734-1087(+)